MSAPPIPPISAARQAGFNSVHAARLPAPYPARSTVITGLVAAADVEVDAVALIPNRAATPAPVA